MKKEKKSKFSCGTIYIDNSFDLNNCYKIVNSMNTDDRYDIHNSIDIGN